MTGEEDKYVQAVERLLDQRLAPLVDQVKDVDARVEAIEQTYMPRSEVHTMVDNAMQQILTAIHDLDVSVTTNRTDIAKHERRLNPWLRMYDAAREIWDARSTLVKGAMGIGAVSGAFIGVVGVVQIITGWFM